MKNQISEKPEAVLEALRSATDVASIMKRSNVSLEEALELLADLLRAFEDYDRQLAAEDAYPFPKWTYGHDALSHLDREHILTTEEVDR